MSPEGDSSVTLPLGVRHTSRTMPQPRTRPTLTEYVAALMEWREYAERMWTDGGRGYRTSVNNRLAKRAGALLGTLRTRSDWPAILETMAASEDPLVRMMAAHEIHEADPDRAMRIFSEIEDGPYGRLSDDAHWAAIGPTSRRRPSPSATEQVPTHPSEFDGKRVVIAEAVLAVHGAIMNGGFLKAFDVAGDSLSDAIRGHEQIGLEPVAQLLRRGVALFPGGVVPDDPIERQRMVDDVVDTEALEALGLSYDELVPTDEFLGDKIDKFLDEP